MVVAHLFELLDEIAAFLKGVSLLTSMLKNMSAIKSIDPKSTIFLWFQG